MSTEASRRYRARLRGEVVPLQVRNFTAEEDAAIREVYPSLLKGDGRLVRLSERLGRAPDAIQSRAARLGLTNPHRGMYETRLRQNAEQLRNMPTRKWHFMTREQAEQLLNELEVSRKSLLAFCRDNGWRDGSRGLRNALRRHFPQRLEALIKHQQQGHVATYFTGRLLSIVHRAKIGLALLGRPISQNTRTKLSLVMADRLRDNPASLSRKQVSKGGRREDLGGDIL